MITNTAKPTTTIANSDKVASFETWASIPTTWASETRTWLETSSLMEGVDKPSSTMTNTAKP